MSLVMSDRADRRLNEAIRDSQEAGFSTMEAETEFIRNCFEAMKTTGRPSPAKKGIENIAETLGGKYRHFTYPGCPCSEKVDVLINLEDCILES